MAQGKEFQVSSTQSHVHRDKCLVVLCVLTDFPFGRDQRMRVHVCWVVDLLLCKSLFVALDKDLKGTQLSG